MEIVLLEGIFKFLIAILNVGFFAYILFINSLNNLHQTLYGKRTILVWIPIVNVYLLGKMTVNKLVGWILFFWSFLFFGNVIPINFIRETYNKLPTDIIAVVSSSYVIIVIALAFRVIFKYKK